MNWQTVPCSHGLRHSGKGVQTPRPPMFSQKVPSLQSVTAQGFTCWTGTHWGCLRMISHSWPGAHSIVEQTSSMETHWGQHSPFGTMSTCPVRQNGATQRIPKHGSVAPTHRGQHSPSGTSICPPIKPQSRGNSQSTSVQLGSGISSQYAQQGSSGIISSWPGSHCPSTAHGTLGQGTISIINVFVHTGQHSPSRTKSLSSESQMGMLHWTLSQLRTHCEQQSPIGVANFSPFSHSGRAHRTSRQSWAQPGQQSPSRMTTSRSPHSGKPQWTAAQSGAQRGQHSPSGTTNSLDPQLGISQVVVEQFLGLQPLAQHPPSGMSGSSPGGQLGIRRHLTPLHGPGTHWGQQSPSRVCRTSGKGQKGGSGQTTRAQSWHTGQQPPAGIRGLSPALQMGTEQPIAEHSSGRHRGQHSPGGTPITCPGSHTTSGQRILVQSSFSTHWGQDSPSGMTMRSLLLQLRVGHVTSRHIFLQRGQHSPVGMTASSPFLQGSGRPQRTSLQSSAQVGQQSPSRTTTSRSPQSGLRQEMRAQSGSQRGQHSPSRKISCLEPHSGILHTAFSHRLTHDGQQSPSRATRISPVLHIGMSHWMSWHCDTQVGQHLLMRVMAISPSRQLGSMQKNRKMLQISKSKNWAFAFSIAAPGRGRRKGKSKQGWFTPSHACKGDISLTNRGCS